MAHRTGTFSQIYLHFIWSTKNREPLIDDVIKIDLVKTFHAKAREMGVYILEANGPEDHMHVLLKSNPTLPASDIAKGLKGSSSHFINHETLKHHHAPSLYWQDGYGVVSVSPGAVKSVSNYIRKQIEHHKKNLVLEEFEL